MAFSSSLLSGNPQAAASLFGGGRSGLTGLLGGGAGGQSGLTGLLGSGGGATSNQIVSLDPSTLAAATGPQRQTQAPQSAQNRSDEPDITPPWARDDHGNSSLASRINEVRGLESFIDESVPGEEAGADERASFIAFDALSKLKTLAQFASEKSTPEASLEPLDAQFQKGLSQVREFLETSETKDLTLLSGEKTAKTSVPFSTGQDSQTLIGRSVAKDGRDDPLAGLNGDERFTLSIEKNGETSNLTIDLGKIDGVPSIDEVVGLINTEIEAAPRDFASSFAVDTDENFDHRIEVRSSAFETLRLRPETAEPAVFLGSNRRAVDGEEPVTARLRQFGNVTGDFSQTRQTDISATDTESSAIASVGGEEESSGPVPADTEARAVATDSEGFVYTVGSTAGDFESQRNQAGAEGDLFLNKVDTNGNVVFSRLLGSASGTEGVSLSVDSQDNVIVTGQTSDNIDEDAVLSGEDGFVTKFTSKGEEVFTSQIDTASESTGLSVTTDGSGDILVAGASSGAIDADTAGSGGEDALALRLDGETGERTDAALIGGSGDERGQALARAQDGNILLASKEDGRAVLRKLDSQNLSNVIFEKDLGEIGRSGDIAGLKVSGSDVVVAGATANDNFDGGGANAINSASDGRDGFVVKLTDEGGSASGDFLSFVGTDSFDSLRDVGVSSSGIFLAGATRGDLAGDGRRGAKDGFLARLDPSSGQRESVEQFGRILNETAGADLAIMEQGPGAQEALGLPLGPLERVEPRDLETQTTARAGDFFEISIDDGPARRVELEPGDTFDDLAARINRLSLQGEVSADTTGGELTIRAQNGAQVDLSAGDAGRDLLGKLGLEAKRLLAEDAETNSNEESDGDSEDEPDVGGAFGFELDQPLSLKSKQAAKFTLNQIESAMETAKQAFQSLQPEPESSRRDQPTGEVPPQLVNEINNFNAALQRLQTNSQSGPSLGGGLGGLLA